MEIPISEARELGYTLVVDGDTIFVEFQRRARGEQRAMGVDDEDSFYARTFFMFYGDNFGIDKAQARAMVVYPTKAF